jgi:aspartyl/glutamyl-tRNA(Asn/Gln) amidotransferase C subunit
MPGHETPVLSADEVRHVAKLARLRLGEEQVQLYRRQLSSVLEHIDRLQQLDVDQVEPMAHPTEITNRLDEDVAGDPMPLQALLANAPAVQDRYLAVPKVLGDDGDH